MMSQPRDDSQTEWVSFELRTYQFGEQVEFRSDGSVRLGNKSFADGRRIDYSFAGNSATRTNAFGAVLKIRAADNQIFCFHFDGDQWLKLVEDYDPNLPHLYSLRQEMAHTGAVLGAIYWFTSKAGRNLAIVFCLAMPFAIAALPYFVNPSFGNGKPPQEPSSAVRLFFLGAGVVFGVILIPGLRSEFRYRRSLRREKQRTES